MAKKKHTPFQRFIIIGGTLIGLEACILSYYYATKAPPEGIKDAIDNTLQKKWDLDGHRREQLRIQLAVTDYMGEHAGKPPPNLQDLVPKYFDAVPIDPDTNEVFPYRVEGSRFFIGKSTTITLVKGAGQTSESEESALIASLSDTTHTAQFVYDPSGKRDPFLPFDFSPKRPDTEKLTPLERYSLGQLKLTAVLSGFDQPAALVEDLGGKGFTVKKGMKIGDSGGEVVDILPDKILILETNVDFTGEKKTRTIEMKMTPKDPNASKGSTKK